MRRSPPRVLEPDARWSVLVATEASGSAHIVVSGCRDVLDCHDRARQIRAGADAGSRVADELSRFYGCEPVEPGSGVGRLEAFVSDTASSCRTERQPIVGISRVPTGIFLDVTQRWGRRALESTGCGYAILPSEREPASCFEGEASDATLVAPL